MSPPVNYRWRPSIARLMDHFLLVAGCRGRHGGQGRRQGTYCPHYFNTPSFMSNLINAMIANLLGWGFSGERQQLTSFRGGSGGSMSMAAGLDFHQHFCRQRIFAH